MREALDAFDAAVPEDFFTLFRRAVAAARAEYRSERRWLAGLPPRLREKLEAQQEEAIEIAEAAEESLAAGRPEEAAALARRFAALARHNLIEKERDVFPYYHRTI